MSDPEASKIPQVSKLGAALAWARRGFRVFPLVANTKLPLGDISHPAAATTDEDQIRRWWTDSQGRELDYNIGCSTVGMIVADVDTKLGKPGLETARQIGLEWATLVIRTPTGGYHLYYQGFGYPVGQHPLGDGIDIRAHNGYVVVPGSTIDGVAYEIVIDDDPAPFPLHLRERLRAPRERRVEADDIDALEDQPGAVVAAASFLKLASPAIEGQRGDATTFNVAARLRDLGLSPATALEMIDEHWNPCCEPPWDLDALRQKVRNGFRYATGSAAQANPNVAFRDIQIVPVRYEQIVTASAESLTADDDIPSTPLDPARRRFALLEMDEVRSRVESDQRVKGLLPKTGLVVVWGAPKTGKSFVITDLCWHIAAGQPYRDRRVKQGIIVYCALEGIAGFGKRLEALYRTKIVENSAADTGGFKIMAQSLVLISEHKEFMQALAVQLGAGNAPAVVVIDTLNRSFEGSESEDKAMTAYVRAATAIIERFGCTVIIVHHCGLKEERMRGHTALRGALDVEISISHDAASNIIMHVECAKDLAAGPDIVSRLQVVVVGVDEDGDPITSCVVEPADASAAEGDADAVSVLAECHTSLLDSDAVMNSAGERKGVPERKLRERFRSQWQATRGATLAAAAKAYQRAMSKLQADRRLVQLPGKVIGSTVKAAKPDGATIPSENGSSSHPKLDKGSDAE